MPSMIESYVDLTYRGLALGKRVKLTQVRPSTGYLEMPAPMPVGTAIGIATEDGVTLEATVAEVREQVAGSERAAGMVVRPKLDGAGAKWWKDRVELPEEVKVEAAPAIGIVRSKRTSGGAVPELVDDGRNTAEMDAVDPASSGEREAVHDTQVIEVPIRDSNPNIVDDGKRTIMMPVADLEALGLDPSSSSSGQMAAVSGDDDDSNGNGDKPDAKSGGGRKKRKRR
jgi:hypothetical protein